VEPIEGGVLFKTTETEALDSFNVFELKHIHSPQRTTACLIGTETEQYVTKILPCVAAVFYYGAVFIPSGGGHRITNGQSRDSHTGERQSLRTDTGG